ncbi:MAG: FprA family A-type flavoprotein [Synergistaceae bacterium]|jgi:flavorubredoxin|nr:FprA family A-type flavoprotein [Synergistaceae bacterium]
MVENYNVIEVADSIFWIGANDRETDKFEGLLDLPMGVAYNSYLMRGEKNVLIDTVKSSFMDDFLHRLTGLLDSKPLDYVIVNHMEPDHSGSVDVIKRLYPDVKFVGNAKTVEMMKNFYGLEGCTIAVKEGETLDIGDRKLVFAFAPMVHWPESMVSYEPNLKILFSNDIFGGFGALEGGIFDDEVNFDWTVYETMRYYVNIVGRYAKPATKALEKVRKLDISMICPSHGPVWRSDIDKIIGLYEKWSRQETDEGVVVVYGSMYGNTKLASDAIARSLSMSGINPVQIYDVSRSNISFITTDIWRYSGLILSCCTYNMELYPPMAGLLRLLANKNMTGRHIGLCGTYSWAGAALREMSEFVEKSNGGWTLVGPTIEIKSRPTSADIEQCRMLGKNMAEIVKNKHSK